MRITLFRDLPDEPSDYRDWRPWFAWRPVWLNGVIVWLETVERRHAGVYPPTLVCPFDYRLRRASGEAACAGEKETNAGAPAPR